VAHSQLGHCSGVQPVLDDPRSGLGQLGHLVPHRLAHLDPQASRKLPPAVLASPRPVVDHLVDLLGRHERAVVPFVPRLPTGLPSRGDLPRRALDERRIARWRPGRILRGLAEPPLQLFDPGPLLLDQPLQLLDLRRAASG